MFFPLIHGSPNGDPPGCNMRPAATFENHVYSTIIQAVSGYTAYCYFALYGPWTSRQPRLRPFAMKSLEVRVLTLSVLRIKTEQYSYQGYSFLWDETPCSLVYGIVVSGEFTAYIFTVGEQRWWQYVPQINKICIIYTFIYLLIWINATGMTHLKLSSNLRCPSSKLYDTRTQKAINQST
jgi:hypothetical protein